MAEQCIGAPADAMAPRRHLDPTPRVQAARHTEAHGSLGMEGVRSSGVACRVGVGTDLDDGAVATTHLDEAVLRRRGTTVDAHHGIAVRGVQPTVGDETVDEVADRGIRGGGDVEVDITLWKTK